MGIIYPIELEQRSPTMMTPFGCKCSEAQLHHVGCECDDRFRVEVWPRGYANGDTKIIWSVTDDRALLAVEAARLFGPCARVAYVRDLTKTAAPARPGEAEYYRGDNS